MNKQNTLQNIKALTVVVFFLLFGLTYHLTVVPVTLE